MNCHYIGKSKNLDGYDKAVYIFFFVLALVFLLLGFFNPIFILGTYVSIVILIPSSLFGEVKCPECNENDLKPINSQEAQNIILVNDLDVDHDEPFTFWQFLDNYDSLKYLKRKICSNCHNTEIEYSQSICYISLGLLFIFASIITIPLALFSPYYLIFNFIFLFIGITGTIPCFMEPVRCYECRKQALIPLNSPEAREIIKEQNIQDIGPVMDPVSESKLYTIHENIVFVYLITAWILSAILMIFLFFYFKEL